MPPNQRRPTGAFRIAFMTSVGVASAVSSPSSARTSTLSGIAFEWRENTPPPAEITLLS